MKKGPLSNDEKEYLTENSHKNIDLLSKNLDRSKKIISKFLQAAEQKQQPVSNVSNLIARDKEKGITIMTESASIESDATRRKPKQPKRYEGCIHTIKED